MDCRCFYNVCAGELAQWLEHEITDRRVRGSDQTFACRLPLSMIGRPGNIPAVELTGGVAVRHRNGAAAERLFDNVCTVSVLCSLSKLTPYLKSRKRSIIFFNSSSSSLLAGIPDPTSASRFPLSVLGQPGSIPALVLPSGGMTARHRKGATDERFVELYKNVYISTCLGDKSDVSVSKAD
ncbi:hypothetical protein CSKR_110206 [Clonorchis sinensis]|uniref:Uncharacterized protein n=1 Tax=Clonorchis sinensis TaxID=79923 RepID=A0A419PQY8_CLOSI|nr:hypothetical protein CSKR_110206 [Clonorchis sinensis]